MAQKFLSVRQSDYDRCQTKSGNSPWVRLHRALFREREFMNLSTSSRFLYIGLLILATEHGNRIYNDPTWIGQLLYIPPTEINLKPLYRGGFLQASNVHRVLRERDRERDREGEGERDSADALPPPPVLSLPIKEKKRPGPLPEDFKFSPDLKNWALERGCKEPYAEFERFCSKAVSKGWVYVDWAKAYQNWVLNELKWAREKQHA